MGYSNYPQTSSPIKSIQRGSVASATTITISAVDISKTFVRSFSTGASGTASISGNESGTLSPTSNLIAGIGGNLSQTGTFPTMTGTRSFSGGTTNLKVAKNGVVLTNSTTLTSTGACNYEVVEYN